MVLLTGAVSASVNAFSKDTTTVVKGFDRGIGRPNSVFIPKGTVGAGVSLAYNDYSIGNLVDDSGYSMLFSLIQNLHGNMMSFNISPFASYFIANNLSVGARFDYGRSTLGLDNVDLDIERGKFTAIIGTSGSGKSTLLNMLGGLDVPSAGSILVDHTELAKLNSEEATVFRRKQIGFVFQNYNLVPVLSVWENIILPISLDGRRPDRKFIMKIVQLLGLEKKLDSLPNQLSGGQQQRVAIARALASKPSIILADEPTGNLDTRTSDDVIGLLKMTSREFHQTIVMITHNPEIARMADRVIHIEDGHIVGSTD